MIRRIFHSVDTPLLYVTLALILGGLLILASASMVLSQKHYGTSTYYVVHQVFYAGTLGILGFLAGIGVHYRFWRRVALPLMVLSLVLLALLFLPQLGIASGGATRWLDIGPISFQPSELLKFSFVVYLASWLDSKREKIRSISHGLIPFAMMMAVVGMFLLMQPDIGTLGVMVATAGLLYFVGGGRVAQIAGLAVFALVILYFVVQAAPYRLERIRTFLDPARDPQGMGYQINQALIAIGSGGFFGRGFGQSVQKYNYLPEPMGDSVFAVFAEEMGFLGALVLILLFAFFLFRGFVVAKHAPDVFGKLLAAGIVMYLMTQAFVNMAAISGLLPLTGIPLPFVSYGGTALAVNMLSVGVLLNISKHT